MQFLKQSKTTLDNNLTLENYVNNNTNDRSRNKLYFRKDSNLFNRSNTNKEKSLEQNSIKYIKESDNLVPFNYKKKFLQKTKLHNYHNIISEKIT